DHVSIDRFPDQQARELETRPNSAKAYPGNERVRETIGQCLITKSTKIIPSHIQILLVIVPNTLSSGIDTGRSFPGRHMAPLFISALLPPIRKLGMYVSTTKP